MILGTGQTSPKARVLRRNPEVALTIDSEAHPYRALQIRGIATLSDVDGVVPEYRQAAERYYGTELAQRWLDLVSTGVRVRVEIEPTWAHVMGLGELFPELFDVSGDSPPA